MVIDKEHLHQETLCAARSLPGNYPVILEVYDKGQSSNAPRVKTFTPKELGNYVKIVQEFSRERFPNEVKHQAELRAMHDKEITQSSSLEDEIAELMDQL